MFHAELGPRTVLQDGDTRVWALDTLPAQERRSPPLSSATAPNTANSFQHTFLLKIHISH